MPMIRALYPPNWSQLSLSIRGDRARWQCECTGQCATRGATSRACNPFSSHGSEPWPRCQARQGDLTMRALASRASRVVLTVAHLDDDPSNNDQTNLLAMCQACHLAYDRDLHRQTRAARRAAADAGRLF